MIAWIKRQEIFLKLLCLMLSVLLWMYVLNVENQDVSKTYKNVAVTLQNEQKLIEERNLIVTSGQNQVISVVLTGKRENLISAESPGAVAASADVSVISDSGTHNLLYSVATPDNLISVKSKLPEFITVNVEQFIYKSIPLEIIVDGNAAENYSLGEVATDFKYVTISGAESKVKNAELAVAHILGEGLTETTDFNMNYSILDKNGAEIESEYLFKQDTPVTATLAVTKNEKKKLAVNLVSAPGVNARYATADIQPEYITVTAQDEILAEIDSLSLGSIDLSQVNDGDVLDVPIKMPNGVRSADEAKNAKVTIHLDGIVTREFTPQIINFNFTSEKYKFEPVLTSMKIKLKGHKSVIDKLTGKSITVNADFRADEINGGNIAIGWHILSTEIELPKNSDIAIVEKGTLIVEVLENPSKTSTD